MSSKAGLLNERAGWLYYGTAVTYAIGGYALGIAGLFNSSLLINAAAILLLAHAMTISILFPKVALLYVVAYLIMMHILRFMDSVQHDNSYSTTLFETSRAPHKGDAQWEQEHTFSNTLSLRFPRLNWLVLNFGYHNAHHADMNLPFYRLPKSHAEISGGNAASFLTSF